LVIDQLPGNLSLLYDKEASIVVTSGSRSLHNLQVIGSTLHAAQGPARIDRAAIVLCNGSGGDCRPQTIEANKTVALRLRVNGARPGTYTGNVLLAADELAAPISIEWTVFSTNSWAIAGGVFLIALGVFLAWVLGAVIRQRASRDEVLLAAAQVGDIAGRMLREVASIEELNQLRLSGFEGQLHTIIDDLSPQMLEQRHLVPSAVANPFSTQANNSTEFASYVSERTTRLGGLAVLLRDGILFALTFGEPSANATVDAAVQSIDTLVPSIDTPSAASAALTPIRSSLRRVPSAIPSIPSGGVRHGITSTADLRIELRRLYGWAWGIWGIITVALGVVAVILTNDGFGTPFDLAKCFFWGLGIQVIGQQLQQLSPSTITSSVGISVPK